MDEALQGWERRARPPLLIRRFTFERYAQTRAFLDALSALCEEFALHPQNISFGTTYVNVTLQAADGAAFSEREIALAVRIAAAAQEER